MRSPSLFMGFLLTSCSVARQEEWISTTIDNRPASGFTLVMKGDEVVGGHDTCNGWGLSDHPGLIVMTTQECPDSSSRAAYWALARGDGATYALQGRTLIARQGRHIGVFRRA